MKIAWDKTIMPKPSQEPSARMPKKPKPTPYTAALMTNAISPTETPRARMICRLPSGDIRIRCADQIYDGRLYEPASRAALAGVDTLTEFAHGTVTIGLYRGNMYFRKLADCPHSLYSPADASMEASDGLNPASSQGYLEVQSVEARVMAEAGQVRD